MKKYINIIKDLEVIEFLNIFLALVAISMIAFIIIAPSRQDKIDIQIEKNIKNFNNGVNLVCYHDDKNDPEFIKWYYRGTPIVVNISDNYSIGSRYIYSEKETIHLRDCFDY